MSLVSSKSYRCRAGVVVYTIRHCLYSFCFLFSIPKVGVTVKCNHNMEKKDYSTKIRAKIQNLIWFFSKLIFLSQISCFTLYLSWQLSILSLPEWETTNIWQQKKTDKDSKFDSNLNKFRFFVSYALCHLVNNFDSSILV